MAPADWLSSAPSSAKWLVTSATLAWGFGPFVVDMNRTHLLHPAWPGHARFHLMWSALAQAAVAGLALILIWSDGPAGAWRCRLAIAIGLAHTGSFFASWALARFYRGTLSDPGGIPPLAGRIDGNIIACLLIALPLLAALVLLHH